LFAVLVANVVIGQVFKLNLKSKPLNYEKKGLVGSWPLWTAKVAVRALPINGRLDRLLAGHKASVHRKD
jgi:hypothetical protein